jgi:hypothetical protein
MPDCEGVEFYLPVDTIQHWMFKAVGLMRQGFESIFA